MTNLPHAFMKMSEICFIPSEYISFSSTHVCAVRLLREELQLLQEPGSYVGEVVKPMGKKKVLVKVHPEGKYVVDIDKNIDIAKVTPNTRVALKNDSYVLHLILPNKVTSFSQQRPSGDFFEIKLIHVDHEDLVDPAIVH